MGESRDLQLQKHDEAGPLGMKWGPDAETSEAVAAGVEGLADIGHALLELTRRAEHLVLTEDGGQVCTDCGRPSALDDPCPEHSVAAVRARLDKVIALREHARLVSPTDNAIVKAVDLDKALAPMSDG